MFSARAPGGSGWRCRRRATSPQKDPILSPRPFNSQILVSPVKGMALSPLSPAHSIDYLYGDFPWDNGRAWLEVASKWDPHCPLSPPHPPDQSVLIPTQPRCHAKPPPAPSLTFTDDHLYWERQGDAPAAPVCSYWGPTMCQALSEHLSLLNFAKDQGLKDHTMNHWSQCAGAGPRAPHSWCKPDLIFAFQALSSQLAFPIPASSSFQR